MFGRLPSGSIVVKSYFSVIPLVSEFEICPKEENKVMTKLKSGQKCPNTFDFFLLTGVT